MFLSRFLFNLSSNKQPKVGKSQAVKYSPVSYAEQREPSYAPQPVYKSPSQPQVRYDYEEETTQRTIQYVQQQQIQQSKPARIAAPQSAPRQHQYDVGIVYSQEPRHMKTINQQQKYQQYLDRSPPVFPASTEQPSIPKNIEHAPFSLFNPAPAAPAAAPRYDVFSRPSKVRRRRKLRNKRKLRNRSFVIIFKKRRYYHD